MIAGVDAATAASQQGLGRRGLFLLYASSLTITASCLAGVLLGIWLELTMRVRWSRAPRNGAGPASTLIALPAIVFVWWVPWSWLDGRWATLSLSWRLVVALIFIMLGGGVIAAVRAVHVLQLRITQGARRRWLVAVAASAATLGAACYVADARLYPGDYFAFHVALAVGFACATVGFVSLMRWLGTRGVEQPRSWENRLRFRALVLAASSAFALVLLDRGELSVFGPTRARVFPKLVHFGRALTDFDGDGYSAWLGGRDCAAWDGERPAAEIPENGRDEDCSGADERWPLRPPQLVARRSSDPLNVILISVDALRADHVGAYGYARETSPSIDRLARESIVFLNAFAQSTKTWDSLPSLLTGIYPSNLPRDYHNERARARRHDAYHLMSSAPLLAEAFRTSGYSTGALVTIPLLQAMGLDRGFQRYQGGKEMTKVAQQWLEEMPEPFFLWLHYRAPHAPYKKHRAHDFGDSAVDRYDSEIASDDREIGRILKQLARRGLETRSVVIVTADHGEEFGEHGGFFHTRKHYKELLHVPLIVKVPGLAAARVSEVVELVDVAPTLHELCGLSLPEAPFDGTTLLETLSAPRHPELRGALAEDVHSDRRVWKSALFDGRWRLIDDRENDRLELYDLSKDPAEQHEIGFEHADVVQRLREQLAVRALRARSPRF